MPLAETAQLVVDMNLKGNFRQGMKGARQDLRGFTTQTSQTTGKLGGLQAKLKSPELRNGLLQGVGLSGGLIGFQLLGTAVNGAVQYMGGAVEAASDLTEAQSKVDEVFEDSAPTVRRWASTIESSFGISERAALSSAGTLGNFLTALGQTEGAAADMSTSVVELAGDLASFNNVSSSDVLVALQAGLAGETEPVRRLGIDISAARVESLLLARGIEKVNGEFRQSDKVLGRYLAIMEDTAKAQGDAARTSDTLAGRQRQLDANLDNLQTTVGELVIGPMTDLTGAFVAGSEAALALAEAIPDLQGNLQGLQKDIGATFGRDIINDLANTTRIISTGGLILLPDAIGDIQDETTGLGGAVEDLVGESTALGGFYNDWFGANTLVGGSLQDLADDITGVERRYDPLSSISVRVAKDTEDVAVQTEAAARSYTTLGERLSPVVDEMFDFARAGSESARALSEFGDIADEVAQTRSLGEINSELQKQIRIRDRAIAQGKVQRFAEASAAIERLEEEKALRNAGRRALRAAQANAKGATAAQRLVTAGIAESKQEAKRLLAQTRKKYGIKVSVNDQQLSTAITKAQNLAGALNSIGGVFLGGFGFDTPGKQSGGPVQAGRAYIVGEQRPELFVPNQNGRIIPNVPSGGGDISVYVTPSLVVAAAQVEDQTTKAVRTQRFREKN